MAKEKTMTIRHGNFSLTIPRSELVEVSETAEGVNFSFKNGLMLSKFDNFMPSSAKQLIKNTSDNFPNANIEINLENYKQPAKAFND